MGKANMNYRVGICGWPRQCFDENGNQLYTPQELEAAAQNDPVGPCPSGVCVPMGHGHNLTSVSFEEYSRAREAYDELRVSRLAQGERNARRESEIISVPVDSRSWLEVLLGIGK